MLMARSSALQHDKHRVPLQVERKEDGVSNPQALEGEVRLRLVGLEAAEGGDMRLVLGNAYNGLGTILTDVVAEQAERASRLWCHQWLMTVARYFKSW